MVYLKLRSFIYCNLFNVLHKTLVSPKKSHAYYHISQTRLASHIEYIPREIMQLTQPEITTQPNIVRESVDNLREWL